MWQDKELFIRNKVSVKVSTINYKNVFLDGLDIFNVGQRMPMLKTVLSKQIKSKGYNGDLNNTGQVY